MPCWPDSLTAVFGVKDGLLMMSNNMDAGAPGGRWGGGEGLADWRAIQEIKLTITVAPARRAFIIVTMRLAAHSRM
jgi:hypothetical protein